MCTCPRTIAQVLVARFFIKKMLAFSVCEDTAYREEASVDWKVSKRDTRRSTIGECFLVTDAQTKLEFLVVRIFWKVGAQMTSALLPVTLYTPPKVENKKVSDWFLEYALALIKWYGIESGGRGDL